MQQSPEGPEYPEVQEYPEVPDYPDTGGTGKGAEGASWAQKTKGSHGGDSMQSACMCIYLCVCVWVYVCVYACHNIHCRYVMGIFSKPMRISKTCIHKGPSMRAMPGGASMWTDACVHELIYLYLYISIFLSVCP